MKNVCFTTLLLLASSYTIASGKDSTIIYNLPDNVKAVAFMADITIPSFNHYKRFSAGIRTDGASLVLSHSKKRRSIYFHMHEHSRPLANGFSVKNVGFGFSSFTYDWKDNTTYKLLIAIASDSATKISILSGYVFLPEENKWKLIGTRRHPFPKLLQLKPSVILRAHRKSNGYFIASNIWAQRTNGTWKNMKEETTAPPVINWFGHIDSLQQSQIDIRQIEDSITTGKTDAKQSHKGIYYTILKEGTGRQVNVTDTVTAHYKGYLLSDGTVFDQTKEKPATFPLRRLIRGWQIGVPFIKVGGKIKLVIPSGLAYSIRTRAAKIPPNSILVFEIEVLEAKEVK